MKTLPKNVWKQLSGLFPTNREEAEIAARLFREYEVAGYLHLPATELFQLSLPSIADFFHRMTLMHSCETAILRRRDTRWMAEFDYTLVNIRAASAFNRPGNFLSAAMFLASLRTNGIILAPVTQGYSENLAFLESHAVLRNDLVNSEALAAGITAELQMAAFSEAAHLLKLVLGYELDYRVAPLAVLVLNKPEYFHWTRNGEYPEDESSQKELCALARTAISSVWEAGTALNRDTAKAAFSNFLLEPLLSRDGSGRVPIALKTKDGGTESEAVKYWCRIFDLWRDRYGFDFLVLKGTRAEEGRGEEVPDFRLIREAADAARKAGVHRSIGTAAEGFAEDAEKFGLQGVDLVLLGDACCKADRSWFEHVFAVNKKLRQINLGRKLRFSAVLETSPGENHSDAEQIRALIKRFAARFLCVGHSRRPLLETMGALQGASGYYRSLEQASPLHWPSGFDKRAHRIEDTAAFLKDMTDSGKLVYSHTDDTAAWWVIHTTRGLLIAVSSVENEAKQPPPTLNFDYSVHLKKPRIMTVVEHDFHSSRGLLHLGADTIIESSGIPYGEFRLYVVS